MCVCGGGGGERSSGPSVSFDISVFDHPAALAGPETEKGITDFYRRVSRDEAL